MELSDTMSGPAMEHYRCMKCYMPKSRMERVADTIQFLPAKIPFPTLSLNDQLMYTLDKLASILMSKEFQVMNQTTLSFDSQTVAELEFLTTILLRMAAPDVPDTTTSTKQLPPPLRGSADFTKAKPAPLQQPTTLPGGANPAKAAYAIGGPRVQQPVASPTPQTIPTPHRLSEGATSEESDP